MHLKWPWTFSDSDSLAIETPTLHTLFDKQSNCIFSLMSTYLLTLFNATMLVVNHRAPQMLWTVHGRSGGDVLWQTLKELTCRNLRQSCMNDLSWPQCLAGVAWEGAWFRRQVQPVATVTSPTCITFHLTKSFSRISRQDLTYKKKNPHSRQGVLSRWMLGVSLAAALCVCVCMSVCVCWR